MDQIEDFLPLLREAIREARSAGLSGPAEELESRASAAYTTSSELLGEVGLAIVALLDAGRETIPPPVLHKLGACLREIQRVWPDLGPEQRR